MELHDQRYIVGIDLGTTNSAVAYVDLQVEERRRRTEFFPIPQLTGPGEISELAMLPSFLYIPGTVIHFGYGSLYEKIAWRDGRYVPADHFLESSRGLFFKASYLWRL